MPSIDPSHETSRTTRRRWWQILTGRPEQESEPHARESEEEPAEGFEEGTYVPDKVPEEWVDNQTAHRVNR